MSFKMEGDIVYVLLKSGAEACDEYPAPPVPAHFTPAKSGEYGNIDLESLRADKVGRSVRVHPARVSLLTPCLVSGTVSSC